MTAIERVAARAVARPANASEATLGGATAAAAAVRPSAGENATATAIATATATATAMIVRLHTGRDVLGRTAQIVLRRALPIAVRATNASKFADLVPALQPMPAEVGSKCFGTCRVNPTVRTKPQALVRKK